MEGIIFFLCMNPNKTRALDRRKKQQNVEIVGDFLQAAVTYREIRALYRKGELRFHHIETLIDDKGDSILFRLKGNCHALFRNNKVPSCRDGERLFDLAVGSIFHEAMKLRENLYQVEIYRPKHRDIRMEKPLNRKVLLERLERTVMRAEQGVRDGIADIGALFDDTLDQLAELMEGYGENELLVRYLITNRKLFDKVYGRRRLEKIFASMFGKGPIQAHRIAALSYLESGYYDMAARILEKAKRLALEDEKLEFLYKYAKGLDAYYNNNYQSALWYFGRLSSVDRRFKGKRTYLNQAVAVCREIALESLAEQNKGMALRANQTAQRLQTSQK
ncbi:MAG: hypothetical protein JRJ26_14615 [Deltaproteobacteria bacterium]|nr:hypothetical protein [Deltaproteobacteria bacterium]